MGTYRKKSISFGKIFKKMFCNHIWRNISSETPGKICVKCNKIKGEVHEDMWN
jgi:hypothetical protein